MPAIAWVFYFSFAVMNGDHSLNRLIDAALAEDIGDGDHSSLACIPDGARGKAVLKIKQSGVLAGMRVAEAVFLKEDPSAVFLPLKNDGDLMQNGEIAFTIESSIQAILKTERLVLNTMQRMSGIATLTRSYTDRIKGYRARVLDTRKTTPNFRLLEKEAVRIGGGYNHRMGLYDMIMLKDNHIDFAGGLEKAIDRAFQYVQTVKPGLKIEVETRNMEEVKRALLTSKVDRIMLDNFSPSLVKEAVTFIGGRVETEASGGINLDNIVAYAETGVDFISVGALIHQAQSLDLSLKADF